MGYKMTENNNNREIIEQTIEQIEELKETIFQIMKLHGNIHNIHIWDLFGMQDKLFDLQQELIKYNAKMKKKEKLHVIINEKDK